MDRRERRRAEREALRGQKRQPRGETDSGEPNLSSNSELQVLEFGLDLGRYIEQRLGVPYASLIHPDHLAPIAVAAYASNDPEDIIIAKGGLKKVAEDVSNQYPDSVLVKTGFDRQQLKRVYSELIGTSHFGEGTVAEALRNARDKITIDEALLLERELAMFYAQIVPLKPELLGPPSAIKLDSASRTLKTDHTNLRIPLPSTNIVIEYGPGITAMHRMPREISDVDQYIAIDTRQFISQAIYSRAVMTGRDVPNIITRMDGMATATDELLRSGASNQADLVIASMVFHFTGSEETKKGIQNAHTLLKPGGIFAMQVLETVKPDQVSAQEVFELARQAFGEPIAHKPFLFTNPAIRETRTAHHVFFRK